MASRIVCKRAGRSRAPPTRDVQAIGQPGKECRRREDFDTSSRELDGQRKPIEAAAYFHNGGRVRLRQGEIGPNSPRTLDEERDCRSSAPDRRAPPGASPGGAERGCTLNSCSPLRRRDDAAGDERSQMRARAEQPGKPRSGSRPPVRSCRAPKAVAGAGGMRPIAPQAAGHQLQQAQVPGQSWVPTMSGSVTAASETIVTPSGKACSHCEATLSARRGFADATRAGEGEQARFLLQEQARDGGDILIAPDQGGSGQGEQW
ncbi:MAG: hypothetical protein KatS3mg059_0272 [Thermomicrobiales bacterium]|nr:MAG: hypothetical protein KatS3mg059_0272 [Thermomicrobiales bacterium]